MPRSTNDPELVAFLHAIDAGDEAALRALLAEHPELVTDRFVDDDETTESYYFQRTLLHFLAENPIRAGRLPDNAAELATILIDAGAEVDAEALGPRRPTTLALVASGCVTRECGVQIPLIETLVARGAEPSKALYAALAEREAEAVEALLRLGARPDLITAAGLGRTDPMLEALTDGAAPEDCRRAMYLAAIWGRVPAVDTLLYHGYDVNTETIPCGTALHWAVWYDHRPLVERLLDQGADLSLEDSRHHATPIGWAEHAGKAGLADFLRDAQPFADAARAIHQGEVETLRKLLAEHPDLATRRIGDNPRTLLHVATDWPGHFPRGAESVRALIAAGADVDARFAVRHTETPLHWAASSDDLEVLEALLDAGAEIEAPGAVIAGGTPLADAVAFGQWRAARRLVERGARMTLWQAAALGRLDRLEELAAAEPPSPEALTNALWCAGHGGSREAAAWLLERGADPTWVGHDHLTCAQAAQRQGHDDLAEWLRE